MLKTVPLLFMFIFSFGYSQNDDIYEYEETATYEEDDYYDYDEDSFINDTLTYLKTTEFSKKKKFTTDLKNKYSGKEFKYVDDLKKEEKKEDFQPTIDTSAADLFISFMGTIFPYLIGFIIVLIILKTFINTESSFWKFGKSTKKASEKLVHDDDENIDESDFDNLLSLAIKNGNYRLATRYHYLATLKQLSQKELIKYDKDKTNTEYQFELENIELRKKFSYLAYIYDYVWYGEFPVDQDQFSAIANKYNSFTQAI